LHSDLTTLCGTDQKGRSSARQRGEVDPFGSQRVVEASPIDQRTTPAGGSLAAERGVAQRLH
jgi:hypothetical protein